MVEARGTPTRLWGLVVPGVLFDSKQTSMACRQYLFLFFNFF